MHEAQTSERSIFLTLTYDEENLPENRSLDKRHWQLFAKRFRQRVGPFRFLHCGEYGGQTHRPHYHALMFGRPLLGGGNSLDEVVRKADPFERELRTSPLIDEIWGKGFNTIGEVTYASARYVASYTVERKTGDEEERDLERVDPETGEWWKVEPEYATMSRGKPGGLGIEWFEKYWKDVYPGNKVVIDGRELTPPAFYDKKLEERDKKMSERMKEERKEWIKGNEWENGPTRLRVRRRVTELRAEGEKDQKSGSPLG